MQKPWWHPRFGLLNNLPPDLAPDKPKRKDFPTLKAYREALRQWTARDLSWVARQLPPDDPQHQTITKFFKKSGKADRKFEAKLIEDRRSGRPHNPRWAMERAVDQFSIYCKAVLETEYDIESARQFEKQGAVVIERSRDWFVEWCRQNVSEPDQAAGEHFPELNLQLLERFSQTKDRVWASIRGDANQKKRRGRPKSLPVDGQKIHELRVKCALKQEELAAKSRMHVSSLRRIVRTGEASEESINSLIRSFVECGCTPQEATAIKK